MRVVTGIDRPLRDEHVIDADPPLRPTTDTWRRRLRAFAGRSISHHALTDEQAFRAGAQRLRGQSVTPGVIEGLDPAAELAAIGALPAEAWLRLPAGSGLARSGEDLRIPADRRIALGDLPIFARADILDAIAEEAPPPPPPAPGEDDPAFPGLRPALPRRLGPALGDIFEADAADALPRAALLVLEPVSVAILAGETDECPPDPRNDPYDDLQLIDGVRAALWFWPSEMIAGDGGADYSLPAPGPLFRNALAHRIFAMEARLGASAGHPWEEDGLPLALVGFNPDWTLAFVDRGAAARLGGTPLPRTPVMEGLGTPALWQARIAQFAEHLSDIDPLDAESFSAAFRVLPPVGGLPRDAVDVETRRRSLFPSTARVTLRPLPEDQVDLAAAESASLAPLRLDRAEEVELLAPVPASVYEPALFEIEALDPAFAAALARITRDRTAWLARREYVRRRTDILGEEITGQRRGWPENDSPAAEMAPAGAAPLSATRIRRAPGGDAALAHSFQGASRTVSADPGSRLFAWVRLSAGGGAAGGALALGLNPQGADPLFPHVAGWGDPGALPQLSEQPTRVVSPLPAAGGWVRLEAPVEAFLADDGTAPGGMRLDGMVFRQSAGLAVDWGPAGVIDANGGLVTWLGDHAPRGAAQSWIDNNETFAWTDVGEDSAAQEEDHGVIALDDGTLVPATAQALRDRWPQDYLSDEFDVLESSGLDAFTRLLESRISRTNDRIDLGFVRSRADIYRLRQFMLGGDAASKLVTSPALADLASRNEGARATSDNLSAFLQAAYTAAPERSPDNPVERLPLDIIGVAAGDAVDIRSVAAGHSPMDVTGDGLFFLSQPFTMEIAGATTAARSVSAPVAARAPAPTTGERSIAIIGGGDLVSGGRGGGIGGFEMADLTLAEPIGRSTGLSLLGVQATAVDYGFVIDDVLDQRPLVGAVERTATVAERLQQAPAVESLEYAVAGKSETLGAAAGLISGGADRDGVAIGDLAAPGWAPTEGEGPVTIAAYIASPTAFRDLDAAASGRHEASYFAAASAAIDNSIALLRLIEGRVAVYRRLLSDAQSVRSEIVAAIRKASARLREIDVEVAEARHDAGVAAALLAEEQARVDGINARRAQVIADHVRGFLFRRPRRALLTRETPVAAATSLLAEGRDVICPSADGAAPEEIRDYIALLTEAPAKWWRVAQAEIGRIDRIEAARDALSATRMRAVAAIPPVRAYSVATPAARTVAQAMTARRDVADQRRAQAMSFNAMSVATMDLSAAHTAILGLSSLADLMAAAHRRAALARLVAQEVERVGDAASCLHAGFGQALPSTRLQWAETLSAFDDPAPLSDLSTLPAWGTLPLTLRRELQDVVDWLFQRIDRSEAAAEQAINELVRICILTASLAPADALVPARLTAPVNVRPGAVLTLAADLHLARVGMSAWLRDSAGATLVQATVVDMGDGAVRAQVMQLSDAAPATLAAGLQFDLVHTRAL